MRIDQPNNFSMLFISLILLALGCDKATSTSSMQSESKRVVANSRPTPSDANTPEGALERFLVALVTGNRDGLTHNSIEGAEITVLGLGSLTGQMQAKAIQDIKKLPTRRHVIGETVDIAGKPTTITPLMVNENRHQIDVPGNPIPFILVNVDGNWKVDPTPIIEARKIAASGLGAPSEQTSLEQANTPEGALSRFLYAFTSLNLEGLTANSIPGAEVSQLVQGSTTPDKLAQADQQLSQLKTRRYAVGETISSAGRSVTITEKFVNENRQMLEVAGTPFPYLLVRIDGTWKVDPAPLINAKKATSKGGKS